LGRAVAVASGVPGQRAADAGPGELVVDFGDELVELGGVLALVGGLVALDLGVGAQAEPELLFVIRGGRRGVGFVLEVPAVAALLCTQ
jgi:hypothetical protein